MKSLLLVLTPSLALAISFLIHFAAPAALCSWHLLPGELASVLISPRLLPSFQPPL